MQSCLFTHSGPGAHATAGSWGFCAQPRGHKRLLLVETPHSKHQPHTAAACPRQPARLICLRSRISTVLPRLLAHLPHPGAPLTPETWLPMQRASPIILSSMHLLHICPLPALRFGCQLHERWQGKEPQRAPRVQSSTPLPALLGQVVILSLSFAGGGVEEEPREGIWRARQQPDWAFNGKFGKC